MLRRNKGFILAAALGVALLITPMAIGATSGGTIDGGQRNPSANQTQAYSAETEIIADTATYGTRQSNKSNNGGGAIYGCRSAAGGSPANNEPCIRANNLSGGLAFEYESEGATVGTITASKPGAGSKPFTTNATGVATGLNADLLDGKGAEDLVKDAAQAGQLLRPFAQVASDGKAGQTRGVAANGVARQGAGDYGVTFNGDLSGCSMSATIAGTAPGTVSVNPALAADKKTTAVDVRTFDPAGAAADRAFHLTANC